MAGLTRFGTEKIIHSFVAFSIENGLPLGYKKQLMGG